uniref:Uncharacterized protein n=1 Tax=Micrurus carvalhoi TaxID=3147026 RepID=A0A2H6NFH0_9SAUR
MSNWPRPPWPRPLLPRSNTTLNEIEFDIPGLEDTNCDILKWCTMAQTILCYPRGLKLVGQSCLWVPRIFHSDLHSDLGDAELTDKPPRGLNNSHCVNHSKNINPSIPHYLVRAEKLLG